MRRYFSLIMVLALLAVSAALFAGETGNLKGVVKDESGKPIERASVQIPSLKKGQYTNPSGEYYINNIPPGTYTVVIKGMGYNDYTVTDVKIRLDETATVNARLTRAGEKMKAVIVKADKETINTKNTSSGGTISEDRIASLTENTVEGIIALQAGVNTVNGEIHVRGGRANEVSYTVDGISVSDPVDNRAQLSVDTDAIQAISVFTGAFTAEYGNAQSGIVNMVTKSGDSYFSAKVEASSDHVVADGNNNDEVKFAIGGPVMFWETDDQKRGSFTFFLNMQSARSDSRYHDYYNSDPNEDFVFNGTSLLATTYPQSMLFDPYEDRDDILGFDLDERNYNSSSFNIKSKYTINEVSNITLAYRNSHDLNYPFNYAWIYAMEHYRESEETSDQYMLTYDLAFMESVSNLKAKFSYYQKSLKESPRGISRDVYYYLDPDQSHYNPESYIEGEYQYYGVLSYSDGGYINDLVIDPSEFQYQIYGEEQARAVPTFVAPGAIFGTYWDDETSNIQFRVDYEQKFGNIHNMKTGIEFISHHIKKDRFSNPWNISNSTRDNYLKTRFEDNPGVITEVDSIYDTESGLLKEVRTYYGNSEIVNWVSETYDASGDVTNMLYGWTPEAYLDALWSSAGTVDGYEADPFQAAYYLQDTMEWEGMVVNAGLRFDFWYLNDDYDIFGSYYEGSFLETIKPDENKYDSNGNLIECSNPVPEELWPIYGKYYYQPGGGEPTSSEFKAKQKYYEDIKDKFETPKMMVSPRLGISHPISDESSVHFAYNYQNQLPPMERIFTSTIRDYSTGTTYVVGNPDLEPQTTVTYEVGLQQQLTDDYILDITAYYKNIYNYVSQVEVVENADQKYEQYVSQDYGSARGIDINIQKMSEGNISGSSSYSIAWANGNNSATVSADDNVNLREFPLDWDMRHAFNMNVEFRAEKDQEVSMDPVYKWVLFPYYMLQLVDNELFALGTWGDFTTTFNLSITSGLPYTPVTSNDTALETNSERMDMSWDTDLKIQKTFDLLERANSRFSSLRVYFQINNLFNHKNDVSVYAKTGDPFFNGADIDEPDGYVYDEVSFMNNLAAKDPSNVSGGRTYVLGMAFNW